MPLRPWQPTNASATSTPSTKRLKRRHSGTEDKENAGPKKSKKSSAFMLSRRNERERNRVHLLNLGFERLRAVLPKQEGEQLSKISTLKMAIWYIEHLDRVLHEGEEQKEEEVGESRVVGKGLGDGQTTQSTVAAAAVGSTSLEGGEHLSPIFPARLDLPGEDSGPRKSITFTSPSDSGYGSSFHVASKELLMPLPTRIWLEGATSTPLRERQQQPQFQD